MTVSINNITKPFFKFPFYSLISQLNWNEYFWILFTSYLLTVLFESPFINLKKLIFPTQPRKVLIRTSNHNEATDLVELSKLKLNNNHIVTSLEFSKQKDLSEKINWNKEKTS